MSRHTAAQLLFTLSGSAWGGLFRAIIEHTAAQLELDDQLLCAARLIFRAGDGLLAGRERDMCPRCPTWL